jgi:hypothetical protein
MGRNNPFTRLNAITRRHNPPKSAEMVAENGRPTSAETIAEKYPALPPRSDGASRRSPPTPARTPAAATPPNPALSPADLQQLATANAAYFASPLSKLKPTAEDVPLPEPPDVPLPLPPASRRSGAPPQTPGHTATAAEIMAAAETRNRGGPTFATPAADTLAAQIIAAGKKRRGDK